MSILKNLSIATTGALLVTIGTVGRAQAFTLDFEGIGDQVTVGNFYSTTPHNFGVTFSNNAQGIVSQYAPGGGSGIFHDQPSGTTALVFQAANSTNGQQSIILNDATGFNNLSFYYTAINTPGSVAVYSDVNDGGTTLASQTLPKTLSDGGPDGTDPTVFGPFSLVSISLPSTAKSVNFGGAVSQILFDNITLTSSSGGATSVPEPSSVLGLLAFGTIGAIFTLKSQLSK